jgi:hypothetical protein
MSVRLLNEQKEMTRTGLMYAGGSSGAYTRTFTYKRDGTVRTDLLGHRVFFGLMTAPATATIEESQQNYDTKQHKRPNHAANDDRKLRAS